VRGLRRAGVADVGIYAPDGGETVVVLMAIWPRNRRDALRV